MFKWVFSTMGIGGKTFPLEQQSKDEEQIVYNGTYDTEGVPHTKSGDRQPVQVSIEVTEPAGERVFNTEIMWNL